MIKIIPAIFLFIFTPPLIANDKSFYGFKWLDDDETVYVIQNKEYPKAGKFGVDIAYTKSDSSSYQKTSGITGTFTYNFNEDYSVDLTYKSYSNSNNKDLNSLLNDKNTKPLVRTIETAALIHFNWIPFYGKLNTLNKIIYMDWGIGLGAGKFKTKSNYKTFLDDNSPFTLQEEDNYGANIKTYFKFYLTTDWNFSVEYHSTGISAIVDSSLNKEMLWFNDILLTAGYLF